MKKIISIILTLISINSAYSQCTSLFFSEYIEGTNSNRAVEIYNPTNAAISLTGYTVAQAVNGSPSPTIFFALYGTLAPGDVFILCANAANTTILGKADTALAYPSVAHFNGDDALILLNSNNDTIDAIGEVGVDPGSSWPVGTGATINSTLVRKNNITQGTKDWAIGITQWDAFPIDMLDSLGAHSIIPCIAPCPATNNSFSVTECTTYTVPSGDETYTTVGTNTVADTIPNSCGSDSIMAITVTILPAIDTSVSNTSPLLTANATGASYQWLDCDNANAIITGETGVSYTATANGNYAVEITLGSCIDTSACENVTGIGVSEIENKVISIYPNPTKDLIIVDFGNIKGNVNYTLTSVEGKVVYQENNVSDNKVSVDISNNSKGIYFLKVEANNQYKVYKVIKE